MEWSRLGKFHQGRTGGLIDGGEALFIAKPPPHVAPHRGGERGLKGGSSMTRSQLCNRIDVRIFGAQVVGDACIFARVEADAAIFGLRERSPTCV